MTTLPAGTIIAFAGNLALLNTPAFEKWLLCDGRAVSASDYLALSNVIGTSYGSVGNDFCLPDYRGMFLRGVDGGAGNDPDSATRTAQPINGQPGNGNTGSSADPVGSVEADAFESHYHFTGMGSYSEGFNKYAGGDTGFDFPNSYLLNTNNAGGSETRPKNSYVYYLIYVGD